MGEIIRDYEMVVLYHPDLEIDLEKPLKKVEKIITAQGGTITKTDNWGKRKLAYTINKQDYAVYVYYEVSLPASSLSKIESTLNIANEVLRYLITAPVPEVEEDEKEEKDSKDEKESSSKQDDTKTAAKAKAEPKSVDSDKEA